MSAPKPEHPRTTRQTKNTPEPSGQQLSSFPPRPTTAAVSTRRTSNPRSSRRSSSQRASMATENETPPSEIVARETTEDVVPVENRSSSKRRGKVYKEAERFVSRMREDTSGGFADPIGEFSTKQLLRSKAHVGPRTLVRFEYHGVDEAVVLCWIDENGKKHHHYQHSGPEWTHQESSNAGHAFALFRKRDGKLITSYRVVAALAEGQVHAVFLPERRATAETVVVEARVIAELPSALEFPADQEWTVSYSFTVPQLPSCDRPDFFETNTIYTWGDLSFDEFSLADDEYRPIHAYKMNQIVPQVMCGECLCGSDPETFVPYWKTFNKWVAQAQHYYQTDQGEALGSRAVCGELFDVDAGERMRTTVHFDGKKMTIRIASEDHPERSSEVVSENPFPNDKSIFPGGWPQFFAMKQRPSTKTFRAYPCFNIEYKAQNADLKLLESMCPLKIHEARFPGSAALTPEEMASQWYVRGLNFRLSDDKPMVLFCA